MNEESRYSNQPVLLIAEDDETSFMLLKAYLSKGNYKLLRAANGKQTIEMLEQNPDISLILMDLKMPVMDGYEAARMIKNSHPDIPIIAQTAYALSGDNQKAIEAGCDDYVSKPIKKEILLKKINAFLPG
jgi:CheY-like chemotaxis protein